MHVEGLKRYVVLVLTAVKLVARLCFGYQKACLKYVEVRRVVLTAAKACWWLV